ncbi:MAG: hypothetical protein OXG81_10225 [Acidobacteria bacterium]|nr:hypothetical protein [Acidobacteriota bacterium]
MPGWCRAVVTNGVRLTYSPPSGRDPERSPALVFGEQPGMGHAHALSRPKPYNSEGV